MFFIQGFCSPGRTKVDEGECWHYDEVLQVRGCRVQSKMGRGQVIGLKIRQLLEKTTICARFIKDMQVFSSQITIKGKAIARFQKRPLELFVFWLFLYPSFSLCVFSWSVISYPLAYVSGSFFAFNQLSRFLACQLSHQVTQPTSYYYPTIRIQNKNIKEVSIKRVLSESSVY